MLESTRGSLGFHMTQLRCLGERHPAVIIDNECAVAMMAAGEALVRMQYAAKNAAHATSGQSEADCIGRMLNTDLTLISW